MKLLSIKPEDRGTSIFIRFLLEDQPIGYMSIEPSEIEIIEHLNESIRKFNDKRSAKEGNISPLRG